ncbi:MAG: hypothetical protein V5A79_05700 [Candidatus Bipolaricaulota bacterium]
MNKPGRNLTILALAGLSLLVLASPAAGAQTGEAEGGESFLDKGLTFINQAAGQLGKWLVKVVDKLVGREVAAGLEVPLGYLSVLTIALLVFGALEVARKVIWAIVGLGWALLALRIVLEVLSEPANP